MKIEMTKDKSLLIGGPAAVEIIEGDGELYGVIYRRGDEFFISEHRSAPLVPVGDKLVIRVDLKNGAYIQSYDGDLIPKSWRELVKEIESVGKKVKLMVIGGVDVGKTGFVTFLANSLYEKGLKVAVVDADTGQSSIGPPTLITLGFVSKKLVYLNEVDMSDAFFVGSTTPASVLDRSIVGTKKLTDKALKEGADVVIIDTTGWIQDRGGRELKTLKISLVEPDYLVFIEKEFGELFHLAKAYLFSDIKIRNLEASPMIRVRSREVRREIRQSVFKEYLKDAKIIEINLNTVNVRYGYIGTGRSVNEEERNQLIGKVDFPIENIEVFYECIRIYGDITLSDTSKLVLERVFNGKTIHVLRPDELENVLVALKSKEEKFLGFGLIKGYDPATKSLKLYTNVPPLNIKTVEIGHIKANEKGEEGGFISYMSI